MVSVGEVLARHLASFGDLPEDDARALAGLSAEVREVRRYKDLLRVGEHPDHVIVVLSGFLCRYTIGAEGARQIHSFYLPNEAPSLETLYMDYMDNSLCAVADSVVAEIPHEEVYRIIDERPHARKLMWRETLVQGAIFREWLMRNSKLPAHAAMAHIFCEMFVRARAAGLVEGDTCPLPITQELLADALGLTSVHTNRTLMVLRDTGAVEWRSGILTVRDEARLREMADFDPKYLHLRSEMSASR